MTDAVLHGFVSQLARRLACRLLARLVVVHSLGLAAVVCVLALLEACFVLREGTHGILFLSAVAVSSLSLAVWLSLKMPACLRVSRCALAIERANPSLQDSLNCALELERKTDRNPLEEAVLEQVRERVSRAGNDLVAPLLRTSERWSVPLLMIAVLFVFAGLGTFTRAGVKIGWYIRDVVSGGQSGIVQLNPAPNEPFPETTDVQLTVDITRWERNATVHYEDENGQPVSFPMYASSNQSEADQGSRFTFTFFSVMKAMRYKVTTPSLDTGWRTLDVYPRPECIAVSMKTVPQPYTGLPPQHLDHFGDVSVIAGDALEVSVKMEHCDQVALLAQAKEQVRETTKALSFKRTGDQFELNIVPETSETWQVAVTDVRGRIQSIAQFALTVVPDLPPVIERRSPMEDTKVKEGDSLRLAASASDDFGLSSFKLQFRVAGRVEQELPLCPGVDFSTKPRDAEHSALWDLPALDVKPGDMISCALVATDNRVPRPNRTRSDVFFITILPNLEEIKADGEMSGEEQKIDISDLVEEAKRLLRMTWDVRGFEDPPKRELEDIAVGIGDLKLEIARRQVDIQEQMKLAQLPEPFKSLFMNAVQELEPVPQLVRDVKCDMAMVQQEKSLANLVRLEIELMKNKAKSDKSQGKDGEQGKDQDGEQQEGEKQQEDTGEKQDETLRQLAKAIEQLRQSMERQERLNGVLKRGDSSLETMRAEQDAIRRDTRDLDQSLVNVDAAVEARAPLGEALGDMTGAVESLRRQDRQRASIHGLRALRNMSETLAQLERAQRLANTRLVQALANEAGELAKRQKDASQTSKDLQQAKDSGGLKEEQRIQARQEQADINKATEALRQKLNRASDTLEKSLPETAEALRKTARELSEQAVSESQKRSLNALLYRRFSRAGQEQAKAAAGLSKVSESLQRTAMEMPAYTQEELRRKLDELQQIAERVRQSQRTEDGDRGREALQAARQEGSKQTGELAKMLKNQMLEDLSKGMLGEGTAASDGKDAAVFLGQLHKTMQIVAEQLLKLERSGSQQLKRGFVAPPDKYRRLVEEYFKQLGQ